MHKKEFFPLYCVHISRFHSAVTSNPKSFFPAATLDPRPRLWTRNRDIGPTTATLDPRPRHWTRDRDFGPATRDPRPATISQTLEPVVIRGLTRFLTMAEIAEVEGGVVIIDCVAVSWKRAKEANIIATRKV